MLEDVITSTPQRGWSSHLPAQVTRPQKQDGGEHYGPNGEIFLDFTPISMNADILRACPDTFPITSAGAEPTIIAAEAIKGLVPN